MASSWPSSSFYNNVASVTSSSTNNDEYNVDINNVFMNNAGNGHHVGGLQDSVATNEPGYNSQEMGVSNGMHYDYNAISFQSSTMPSTSSSYANLDNCFPSPAMNFEYHTQSLPQDEKPSPIAQGMELKNTLEGLSKRMSSMKEEMHKLRSENHVLGQYIENLMTASSVVLQEPPKTT